MFMFIPTLFLLTNYLHIPQVYGTNDAPEAREIA